MRIFPRASRRRLWAASVAGSLALGVVAAPLAHAEDSLKDKQKHVQGQIKSASHDLDESSARMRQASAALEAAKAKFVSARNELIVVRAKLDAAKLRDQQMQEALAAAEQRLAEAQADLDAGRAQTREQRLRVTDTITSIYEEGDPQLLAFASLLQAQDPADITRRMLARDVIVSRDTRAYDDLHAALVLLKVREDEVEAAKEEVARQREAAAAHLNTMRDLYAQSQTAEERVRQLVRERRDARQAAFEARRQDLAELAALKRREEEIRQQILEAARNAKGDGYRGATNGYLNYPVNGPITSPFGYRIHPIYHYWGLHDGDDFGAPCGAPLYAVANGTVLSEYYSSVWGNRLYLNLGMVNGKNLTVIYNHLSAYRVGTGARVTRGEVVGYVGTTGWSTGCHLHFTVMVNGVPVDPTTWF